MEAIVFCGIQASGKTTFYRMRFAEMNRRMVALIKKGVTKDQMKTLDQARAQLKLADLGWDNSVSTTTWFGGFSQYYDELAK